GGLEELDLAGVWRTCAPHARAGREDLEGVGTQLRRMERGVFEGRGGRCVEAQSQRYILSYTQSRYICKMKPGFRNGGTVWPSGFRWRSPDRPALVREIVWRWLSTATAA